MVRCQCLTLTGRRCAIDAVAGSKYCGIHRSSGCGRAAPARSRSRSRSRSKSASKSAPKSRSHVSSRVLIVDESDSDSDADSDGGYGLSYRSASLRGQGKSLRVTPFEEILAQAAEMYVADQISSAVAKKLRASGKTKISPSELKRLEATLVKDFKNLAATNDTKVQKYYGLAAKKRGCDLEDVEGQSLPETWQIMKVVDVGTYNNLKKSRRNRAIAPALFPFVDDDVMFKAWKRVSSDEKETYLKAALVAAQADLSNVTSSFSSLYGSVFGPVTGYAVRGGSGGAAAGGGGSAGFGSGTVFDGEEYRSVRSRR